jgi:RNA polymerase primary sigma factor
VNSEELALIQREFEENVDWETSSPVLIPRNTTLLSHGEELGLFDLLSSHTLAAIDTITNSRLASGIVAKLISLNTPEMIRYQSRDLSENGKPDEVVARTTDLFKKAPESIITAPQKGASNGSLEDLSMGSSISWLQDGEHSPSGDVPTDALEFLIPSWQHLFAVERELALSYPDSSALKPLQIACAGIKTVRDRLFQSNIRLVGYVARRVSYSRLSLADRIQEGSIGLLKAIERFDTTNGAKFSTYAVWWIRQAILRADADLSRLIRIPVHALSRISRASANSRCSCFTDITEEIQVPSFSRSNRENSDQEYRNCEADDYDESGYDHDIEIPFVINGFLDEFFEEKLIDNIVAEVVRREIANLSLRERVVIIHRYGIGGIDEKTLKDLGQVFHVTRERIRQIEMKAEKRLAQNKILKRIAHDYGFIEKK